MYTSSVLELITIFIMYSLLIFGLAEIIAIPFTRGKGIIFRFCTDIVVGNFYVINIMFLLAYLKCLNRPVLIPVLLVGACLIRYLADRKRLNAYWIDKYHILFKTVKGEYGSRLLITKIRQSFFYGTKNVLGHLCKGRLMEGILLLAALLINVYYFSYQTIHFMSYAAPDVEVHLSWIQSLVGGNLFPSGVYPFGMHCVGAAVSLVFDVSAVTVARMLGVVTSFYIMLLCYLFVKSLCRLKYAPIVGFFIFSIANITVYGTYMRYSAMISQEYAMLFLCPMMFYLFRYLNDKRKQDLVFFGMSFSLTLAVHFYVTAIACIFFLAIGIVYLYRMIKRKMLLPIILCGVISVVAAIFPLAVGLCAGYELEQSFIYGASVVMNDSDMYSDSTGNKETVEEEEEEEKIVNYTPELVYQESVEQLEVFVFSNIRYIWIYINPCVLVFLVWLIHVFRRKKSDRIMEYLALMLYMIFIMAEVILEKFDLPIIVEPKRMGIFVAYLLPLLMAIPFEILYWPLKKLRYSKPVCNIIALLSLGAACALIYISGNVKEIAWIYYFQTTGAMKVACNIIDTYEKNTWTIVSPVNETSVTANSGFHYEIVDYLKELEHYKEGTEIYIPTEYVFFYVEKMPIQDYGNAFPVDAEILRNRDKINMEAAKEEYEEDYNNPDEYYKYKRKELMSRMYYWAVAYQKYFPDEMTVYYEDDEIVVYRLKQDVYALNNLAIDYRKEMLYE